MKIEVIRKWYLDDVRILCIREGWYTYGSNDDYEKMLKFVEDNAPTPEAIYKVAKDIAEHSDVKTVGSVTSVMFLLERKVVSTFYEVVE